MFDRPGFNIVITSLCSLRGDENDANKDRDAIVKHRGAIGGNDAIGVGAARSRTAIADRKDIKLLDPFGRHRQQGVKLGPRSATKVGDLARATTTTTRRMKLIT